jgi:hypothetical protein
MHVFADLPPGTTDAQVLAMIPGGTGQGERIDRTLFKRTLRGLTSGSHALTIVAFEPTGTRSITRTTAVLP